MTREEAAKILKRNRLSYDEQEADKFCKAYEMAISALEQEPCFSQEKSRFSQEVSQEPCDDVISRDFLFKVLDNFCGHDRTATITLDTLADIVYDLPSVTQKSGKWDISCTCSVCGKWRLTYSNKMSGIYKYCPNCGAKMVEPQESEEQTE